ncbi:MAG TPA: hypothetical protein VJ874_00560, partial [Candidatus Thermoplasmatota archaeon]|nr:hypothetical protein [Candidatus Thermoplasmatota archaeon]
VQRTGMGERTSASGGKARQAFGKSGSGGTSAAGDKASEPAGRSTRHTPGNVQGALDKMAAGMGERRRAREEARERARHGEQGEQGESA